jgi:hypothetical protein
MHRNVVQTLATRAAAVRSLARSGMHSFRALMPFASVLGDEPSSTSLGPRAYSGLPHGVRREDDTNDADAASLQCCGSGRDLFATSRERRLFSSSSSSSAARAPPTPPSGAPPLSPLGAARVEADAKKMSSAERMKEMVKQYGPIFMVYWTGLWAFTGVGFFAVVEYTSLVNVEAIVSYAGLHEYINPTAGSAAVAFAVNEMTEIVRFPFVIMTTPAVAAWWRSVRSTSS